MSIASIVALIRNAIYGKDVRENIAAGIEEIDAEVASNSLAHTTRENALDTRQSNLEGQFDSLIINAGSSNAEVVAGRTSNVTGKTSDTIGHRIDVIESNSAICITDFGAVGDALYYNSATNKYYSDAGFTKLASPFSDIFNLALLTAQALGMDLYIPGGKYLIDKEIILRSNVNIRRFWKDHSFDK